VTENTPEMDQLIQLATETQQEDFAEANKALGARVGLEFVFYKEIPLDPNDPYCEGVHVFTWKRPESRKLTKLQELFLVTDLDEGGQPQQTYSEGYRYIWQFIPWCP